MDGSASTDRDFKAAIVIPVYNHEAAIGLTLARTMEYDYPVLLVDDGSSATCRDVLIQLERQYGDRVNLLRLKQNGGKGAAVKAGLRQLLKMGYTHAVQIDADGQHELADLPLFIATGQRFPDTLVTGYPQYDESVPVLRYYARYLTHVWVWINTLSFRIKDTMCGFRVYPLAQVVQLLDQEPCGNRMDFDPEVIVRWAWRGLPIESLPTRVNYPIDGVSHFNAVKDNILISLMHARLFFGMLARLPSIIGNRRHG
ncbi:glycosyltransferase involved in cell wall biosynthesis [Oceanisphaera litoralis]|uniref:glycosyltransferase n=1 Tax=Oceanisphaera litoralis TaxID=225144 RepID=UPI00195AC74F|nr:glycosyltransferase involved in cell wall biosynthesis [Oceanisphaera litoralis]